MEKDQAHADYVKSIADVAGGIAVFDYEPGGF